MALTEIITTDEETTEMLFSRGDTAVLVDINGLGLNELLIPEITGGGDEVSFYVYT